MITDYHVKLFANELLQRYPSDSVERFTATLMDSKVDLNPHQIDAALFAFRSPLSKGAILADEVGLGKTIEAGIVLAQKWAERKRKILIIVPSNLRKQWCQELMDKFYLPAHVLESANFNKAIKNGELNPFNSNEIILCSYQFARNKSSYVQQISRDIVVIDEAHRLRNVYKSGNKIARELKTTLFHVPKMLLTATPLQNSLLELYSLVSFIDEHIFGDLKSFRNQFLRLSSDSLYDNLKQRLQLVCKRTLRRQVLEYIKYTKRRAYTQEFIPTPDEEILYAMVSDYLRKPDLQALQALPASQRTLMTLVLRKLLASSTFAIAGALNSLADKLQKRLNEEPVESNDIEQDFETFSEIEDESNEYLESEESFLTEQQRKVIENEILELRTFYELAIQITNNAKGEALLKALNIGFTMAIELGGAEKAIIFTESRRTQDYLVTLLTENGFGDDLVLFNGTNNDNRSKEIYKAWKNRYDGTDKVSNSKTADIRAALVDHFSNSAKIMIATEAAAEGINLQFCSLVVNYDLPWNPQRIEQRIGRCHRYGQKHDVVVVNFLNKKNAADQRVFQLLSEKFQLFDGVFGASDEVLGTIESGVDFEKRIMAIYQTCRESDEIQHCFDKLQEELSEQIQENMKNTRQKLLEHFDTEVAEKLNIYNKEATESLNKAEHLLWNTTKYIFHNKAVFNDTTLSFQLEKSPKKTLKQGNYALKHNGELAYHYRLQNPVAQWVLQKAQNFPTPSNTLQFDYTNTKKNICILEELIGKQGVLTAYKITVEAFEAEDHILCIAKTNDGETIDSEQARRLFDLPATIIDNFNCTVDTADLLIKEKQTIINAITERNSKLFDEEMENLDYWAEDKKQSLDIQIKDLDREIKFLKAEARKLATLDQKVSVQRKVKTMEGKRTEMRKRLFIAQDEIDLKKESILDTIETRLNQRIEETVIFAVNWKLV